MSSSSNRLKPAHGLVIALAITAAIAGSLSATARAEIDPDTAAASLNIAAVGLNAAAVGIAEKDKPTRLKPQPHSSLRCWQFGKLLFEENNLKPSSQALDKSLGWKQGDRHTPSLHLLQLNDTVCVFKASDGGVRAQ